MNYVLETSTEGQKKWLISNRMFWQSVRLGDWPSGGASHTAHRHWLSLVRIDPSCQKDMGVTGIIRHVGLSFKVGMIQQAPA